MGRLGEDLESPPLRSPPQLFVVLALAAHGAPHPPLPPLPPPLHTPRARRHAPPLRGVRRGKCTAETATATRGPEPKPVVCKVRCTVRPRCMLCSCPSRKKRARRVWSCFFIERTCRARHARRGGAGHVDAHSAGRLYRGRVPLGRVAAVHGERARPKLPNASEWVPALLVSAAAHTGAW